MTFLFTDIEGSTRAWEEDEAGMRTAAAIHDGIIRSAVEASDGVVFSTAGDSFAAAFNTAPDALAAARQLQAELASARLPNGIELSVRIGLHTGVADERDNDYFGRDVNQAARVMDAAHGGQTLTSGVTAALLSGHDLVDHGEHALRDLESSVHLFEVTSAPGQFPALRTLNASPTNLPKQRSSFIGRDDALTHIAREISGTRMVTLTGVGGIGKTRLAVHSAARALPEFRDGCWFVGLAPIHDIDGLADSLSGVLAVPKMPGLEPLEACLRSLAGKSALLVVDNCEHMIDDAADFCEDVLDRAPGVHILATSREGLAIDGEQVLAVRSLSFDDDGDEASEAVDLFVDRARSLKPDFGSDGTDLEAIRTICRRLDGMPLAIELAAARVPTLTPVEILDHLEDRFSLLTGGRRRSRGRHQALRSTIDWSYGLLSEAQQVGFRRLAAFASTFGFDEACAATGISSRALVADLLDDLVGKSLLEAEATEDGTRYRLLETIRQYGEELLEESGEMAQVMGALGDHYTGWAEIAVTELLGPEERKWIALVDREVPNLRRLVDWAIDNGEAEVALSLLAPFNRCVNMSAYLVTQLAWSAWQAFRDMDLCIACEAFSVAAEVPCVQDDLETTEEVFARIVEIAEATGTPVPSSLLNIVAQTVGSRDPHRGHVLARQALAQAVAAGDTVWEVHNVCGVIVWGISAGVVSASEAAELSERGVRAAAGHSPTVRATASFGYAFARTETDPEEALFHFRDAMAAAAPGTVVHDAGLSLALRTAIELGRPEGAAELLLPVVDEWITYRREAFLDFAIALAAALGATADEADSRGDARALIDFAATVPRIDVIFPGFVELTRQALDGSPADDTRNLSRDEAIEVSRRMLERLGSDS